MLFLGGGEVNRGEVLQSRFGREGEREKGSKFSSGGRGEESNWDWREGMGGKVFFMCSEKTAWKFWLYGDEGLEDFSRMVCRCCWNKLLLLVF